MGRHGKRPPQDLGLFTDLYELTMLQSYFDRGMDATAVFDFFVRELPPNWNFLIACGLEDLLRDLERFRFTDEAIRYLQGLKRFTPAFLNHLKKFRFTGDLRALPEGTLVFPQEPLVEVVAPLPQAQLIETLLIQRLHFQTLMASKGARVVLATRGKNLVDFGLRRMHGLEASLEAARAFYLAGFGSTSNLKAGEELGLPVAGTMAHSYIQAHENEEEAFEHFLETYPEATLLIDTYDVLGAAECLVHLKKRWGKRFRLSAVRLDSGDLERDSRRVRRLLDRSGMKSVQIFASGGLDEYEIDRLLREKAPIDGFGVGTRLGVSSDRPYLDCAYKLVEYAGTPRRKLSEKKVSLPGGKQVFRRQVRGRWAGDELASARERRKGEPLLRSVMKGGRRLRPPPPLEELRRRVWEGIEKLPDPLRSVRSARKPYAVDLSPGLRSLIAAM